MKNPPVLIAVIGFFAALAGFGYLFFGLQLLGFDWFGALGDLPVFEGIGLWGWLAVATGIVWLLVAGGLWALQPWARLFALIVAGFALLEAGLAFIQFPGTGIGFAMALMPALLLWYLTSAEVKLAFGERAPLEGGARAGRGTCAGCCAGRRRGTARCRSRGRGRGGRCRSRSSHRSSRPPERRPRSPTPTRSSTSRGSVPYTARRSRARVSGPPTTCSRRAPRRTTASGSPRRPGSAAR